MTSSALAKFSASASGADAIDSEITDRVKRMTSGAATAADVSEVTKLVRQRAAAMMPGVFSKTDSPLGRNVASRPGKK